MDDVALANSLAVAAAEVDEGPPDYNSWPSDDVVVYGYLAARRLGWDGDLPIHVQHAVSHMVKASSWDVRHLGEFKYQYDDGTRQRHLDEHHRDPDTDRA